MIVMSCVGYYQFAEKPNHHMSHDMHVILILVPPPKI